MVWLNICNLKKNEMTMMQTSKNMKQQYRHDDASKWFALLTWYSSWYASVRILICIVHIGKLGKFWSPFLEVLVVLTPSARWRVDWAEGPGQASLTLVHKLVQSVVGRGTALPLGVPQPLVDEISEVTRAWSGRCKREVDSHYIPL